MKLFKTIALVAVVLGSQACYRMTVKAPDAEVTIPKVFPALRAEGQWQHYVIGGIIPLRMGDVKRICGNYEFEAIHMRKSFLSRLAAWGTYGIYVPSVHNVQCANPVPLQSAANEAPAGEAQEAPAEQPAAQETAEESAE